MRSQNASGHTSAAADGISPAPQQRGADETHLREGERHWAAGNPEAALGAFASALLANPSHREAFYALGRCLEELGRPGDAERIYRRCASTLPDERPRIDRLIRALHAPARLEPRRPTPGENRLVAGDAEGHPVPSIEEPDPDASAASPAKAPASNSPPPVRARGPRVLARRSASEPSESEVKPRARVFGVLSFPLVLATYVVVGLAVHAAVGLLAAIALGVGIAAIGSLLLSRLRWQAFVGALYGMIWGVFLTIGAGIIFMAMATVRQPEMQPGAGMRSDPLQIVIPLRWLECASGVGDPAWCGEGAAEEEHGDPADVVEATDGVSATADYTVPDDRR